jgi:hypothetical protein
MHGKKGNIKEFKAPKNKNDFYKQHSGYLMLLTQRHEIEHGDK